MPIVAYHNSWPYFARRFRLDFVGFIEVKPGVPPSPAHLAGIVRTMRARGVRIVVREPHEPERDVAFVAGKAGAAVVTLAASVGALPQAGDYIALFDANVAALIAAAAAMSEALAFLWPPFLVAVCLVGIHAYFGIQVLARKVIFVDLALAQIAALGATVGVHARPSGAERRDLRLFARLHACSRRCCSPSRAPGARACRRKR